MKKSKLLNNSLLVLGIIFSTFGCTNDDGALIRKMSNEISELKNELNNLKEEKEQLERNKKLVIDFTQDVFGDLNADAVHKYIGDTYIQHDPNMKDGKEALIEGAKIWFKDGVPHKIDVRNIAAEGNLVFIHLRGHKQKKEISVIDVFRIENGKFVEHWDLVQEVPEKSINPHPMF